MERIEGRIIDIKNDYTVVINKGSQDGVEEGMRFIIYELGEALVDPVTSEPLGNMEYVKAKVKVNYAGDKYCTAVSYDTETFSPYLALAGALAPRFERKPLPLDQETKEKISSQDKRDLTVKIGDHLKQIID